MRSLIRENDIRANSTSSGKQSLQGTLVTDSRAHRAMPYLEVSSPIKTHRTVHIECISTTGPRRVPEFIQVPADGLKSTKFSLSRYKILSIKYLRILPLDNKVKPDKIK